MATVKELMAQGKLAPKPVAGAVVIGMNKDEAVVNEGVVSMRPIPQPLPITQPIRTSSNEVIFQSARKVFNFMFTRKDKGEIQVRFIDGWLKTSDLEVIAAIKKNYMKQVKIVESGALASEIKAQQEASDDRKEQKKEIAAAIEEIKTAHTAMNQVGEPS